MSATRKTLIDPKDDPENPEITAEEFRNFRPAREVLPPEFFEALERRRNARGPQKAPTKKLVSLRLDPDIIAHLRAEGPGWQVRANDLLRKACKL